MSLERYPTYGQPISKAVPEPATSFRYDRNPITVALSVAPGTVAPHADTIRASYTIPTGKRAILEAVDIIIEIITAAGPSGDKRAELRYVPNGGADTQFIRAGLLASSNTIGDKQFKAFGLSAIFSDGDVINARTADIGTGGTTSPQIKAKFTEYEE